MTGVLGVVLDDAYEEALVLTDLLNDAAGTATDEHPNTSLETAVQQLVLAMDDLTNRIDGMRTKVRT